MDELERPVGEVRAAQLWLALVNDVTATPCRFPCLRDDLTDWLRHHLTQLSDQEGVGDDR